MDNIDLIRKLEDSCRDPQHVSSEDVLSELEQRASQP